jgi:transcriptional regulator with XRE-family HTH domain
MKKPMILGMISLEEIGATIARARAMSGLRQIDLASRSSLSRATIDALENGRARDIGYSKLARILGALGLELSIRPAANGRPTLDELLQEDADD